MFANFWRKTFSETSDYKNMGAFSETAHVLLSTFSYIQFCVEIFMFP